MWFSDREQFAGYGVGQGKNIRGGRGDKEYRCSAGTFSPPLAC